MFYCPLQVEREKAALMTSLQEAQIQLQHTEGALTEQHDKARRLSQRVTALRRQQQKQNQEVCGRTSSEPGSGTAMQPDRDEDKEEEAEEDEDTEDDRTGVLSKSQVFSYQTPGLEILQCKYRVAVTEVVELKAEVKLLRERLTHCEGSMGKPQRYGQLQKLEKQVASLEKSCREGREKVTLTVP